MSLNAPGLDKEREVFLAKIISPALASGLVVAPPKNKAPPRTDLVPPKVALLATNEETSGTFNPA